MKKLVGILSVALCLIAVLSFKPVTEKSAPKNVSGIYTVATDDPSQIKLDLKYDHTFSYQDFSNADNKVTVYGRWEEHDGKVLLKDYVSTQKIRDKWRITTDGKFAKSIQGLTIYSLQKLEGC